MSMGWADVTQLMEDLKPGGVTCGWVEYPTTSKMEEGTYA